ncbi:MAG TPA: TolC family protein [Phycisphaerae bacterium]|nr:TolC family protein [Phycisphaerae bacterium]
MRDAVGISKRRRWEWSIFPAIVAAATLGSGCAVRPSWDYAGAKTLAVYAYQNDEASAAEPETQGPATDRFTALPKKPEAAPSQPPAGQTPEAPSPVSPAGGPPTMPNTRLAGFVDPLTKRADRIPITLESCLKRALANNLSIQIARYGPAIARAQVVEAEALFDPSWFLNSALQRLRSKAGTALAGATTLITRQWDFSTGIETLLPTGATVSLAQDWTYLRSNSTFLRPNPQYDADLVLSVRQPLLRGAGEEVNRSSIVLAQLDQRISAADFKIQLMASLLEVEKAYWNLVVAETRVEALNEALQAARENQRIAKRRFEVGKDKRVILSMADSAVASREADLIAARLNLAQASDRLKRLINDRELPLEEPVVLAAAEHPVTEPMPVGLPTLQTSMLAALTHRPEMEQAEARLSQAGVRQRVAKNDRLPQLDMTGSYGFSGLNPDVGQAIDEQYRTEFYDWAVGLEFSVPIGNRARNAAYERRQLERDRTTQEREDVRQTVLLEVREAVRNLAAAAEAILATRSAREAAEQSLHDQQANVSAGAALVKDLLDAQRDLADAKVREIQTLVFYMVGLADLERVKGTLLEYNNIHLVEEGVRKSPSPLPETPKESTPKAASPAESSAPSL